MTPEEEDARASEDDEDYHDWSTNEKKAFTKGIIVGGLCSIIGFIVGILV